MDNRGIGIYDSGLGGLSVWRAIRERLPHESLLYLGDGKNCPYGLRSPEEIRTLAFRAVEELLNRGCKMVVVACNTATNAAIEELRAHYPHIPFVGMEPAVKPACLLSKSGVVGVLATQSSIDGDMFHRTAAKYGENIRVIAKYGRGFVELVEGDMERSPIAQEVVRGVVEEFTREGVDQIVLGCTHYPFLSETISRFAPHANIIDPSPAVAKQTEKLLIENDLLSTLDNDVRCDFLSFAGDCYIKRLRKKADEILRR
ncbi:MAG: glutamate racemase [Rikenellaceae bacterium]